MREWSERVEWDVRVEREGKMRERERGETERREK